MESSMPNPYIQIIDKAEQLWLKDTSPFICDCLDSAVSWPGPDGEKVTQLRGWIESRLEGAYSAVTYLARSGDIDINFDESGRDHPDVIAFREQLFVEMRKAFAGEICNDQREG
jgi:hypothetical protein